MADSLSLLDQLVDTVGQSQSLTLRTLRSDEAQARLPWRDTAGAFQRDPADPLRPDDSLHEPHGLLASFQRFGFALDLGAPDGRSGGIAWSPNETVSIGAGGGIGHGVEGRLYLRIRF